MRQYAGFGTAEETNERFRYLLGSEGQTGLSVAFDLPTQMGYDSDHARWRAGEVGRVGVAIDSLDDMRRLVRRHPPGRRDSTSMTINSTAADPPRSLRGVGRRAGRRLGPASGGTVQNDVLKEYIARGTYIYPVEPSLRLVTDVMAFCAPGGTASWNTDLHLRLSHPRGGIHRAQEVAFTFANGLEYVRGPGMPASTVESFRAAPVVLLRGAQRLARGGGEISGFAARPLGDA